MKIHMKILMGVLLMQATFIHADLVESDILTYFSFDAKTSKADAGSVKIKAEPNKVTVSEKVKRLGDGSLRVGSDAQSRLTLSPSSKLSDKNGVFTIVMWVNRSDVSTYGESPRSEFLYAANNFDHNLRVNQIYDARDTLSIHAVSDDGENEFPPAPKSSLVSKLDTWLHVGVVYDFDNDVIRVYINGTQTGAAQSIMGWDGITFDTFSLGNHESQSRPFIGYIDDFAVLKGAPSEQQWLDLANGKEFLEVFSVQD